MEKEKSLKSRGYMGVSVKYIPERKIVVWKMFNCCECGGENIFSIKLDDKHLDYLKEVLRKGEEDKTPANKEDLDEILKAIASLSPPKTWRSD